MLTCLWKNVFTTIRVFKDSCNIHVYIISIYNIQLKCFYYIKCALFESIIQNFYISKIMVMYTDKKHNKED